jgi:hypothetical protein
VRPHDGAENEGKTLGHAVVFLLVMLASPAISKDFGILTRMLYAAFLAEQGVAICTVADPSFASETSGPMGYMRDYAQHVKAEVTAGLNETDTLSLLKSAADRAKAEALQGRCHIVERRTREFCVPNIFKRPRLPRATCS